MKRDSQKPPPHATHGSWPTMDPSAISLMVKCGHSSASVSAGVDPCPRQGGIQGTRGQEARGPWEAGSGPSAHLGVSHQSLTGNRAVSTPTPHFLQPSQARITQSLPTWYPCFPGSLALGSRGPADTSWGLQGDRVSGQPMGTRTWGAGSPPGGGSQRVRRAVLFSWKWICIGSHSLTLPLAKGLWQSCRCPPRRLSRHCV